MEALPSRAAASYNLYYCSHYRTAAPAGRLQEEEELCCSQGIRVHGSSVHRHTTCVECVAQSTFPVPPNPHGPICVTLHEDMMDNNRHGNGIGIEGREHIAASLGGDIYDD